MSINLITSSLWNFNDTEFPGDLYLNKDTGTILLYIRVPSSTIKSYFLFPQNIKYINSKTLTGVPISLLDLHRISTKAFWGSEHTYSYQANILIHGVEFNSIEEIKFTEMNFQIPGILKWGGKSVFNYPIEDKSNAVMDYNLLNDYSIYENDEYKLSYTIGSKFPFVDFEQEEMTFYQYPGIKITPKIPNDYHWFFNIAIKFKNLIEIAIGTPLAFDKVDAYHPKFVIDSKTDPPILQGFEIIHNFKNPDFIPTRKDIHSIDFLFNLDDLLNHLDKKLWEVSYEKLEPIFKLYINDLYDPYPSLEQKFINIIQALETFHARFICEGKMKDFRKRVDKIVSLTADKSKEGYRQFLLGNNNTNFITLGSRISDLILCNFEYIFELGNFSLIEFPKIIAKTRNYYIHYDSNLKNVALSGDNLYEAYLVLKNILEYYLLKAIGFKQDYIHKKMKDRNRKLVNYVNIKSTDNRLFE